MDFILTHLDLENKYLQGFLHALKFAKILPLNLYTFTNHYFVHLLRTRVRVQKTNQLFLFKNRAIS